MRIYKHLILLALAGHISTAHAAEQPAVASPQHMALDKTFLRPFELRLHKNNIDKIAKYLTGLTTIKSNFTQLAPDGNISNGTFYLKRPGKMRWEYAPPHPVLIIANGIQLVFYDRELEQVSYIPLTDSLLGFISQKEIRFDGSVGITELQHKDGVIRVTLADKDAPDDGTLMMEFSENPMLLTNLVVSDATGQITTVLLSDAQFGVALKNDLFVFNDPRKSKRR